MSVAAYTTKRQAAIKKRRERQGGVKNSIGLKKRPWYTVSTRNRKNVTQREKTHDVVMERTSKGCGLSIKVVKRAVPCDCMDCSIAGEPTH